MSRIIFHVDMDAFYASIEMLDHPELTGKAVIVGGGLSRGVVSACSYEARKFGVHSAMPMATALRLCPHAVVRPVQMARYQDVSGRIMALLSTFTPLLEQVSVDEAYLDMTRWLPSGTTVGECALGIQRRILEELGLSCSIGVASGKAIAKMASDLRKPGGLVIVPPGGEDALLAPLPIAKLRGVGKATEERLRALGVRTIGDLAQLPELLLTRIFGVAGPDLLSLARGQDDSPVVPERQAKSIGRETTFSQDVRDRQLLERTLLELADDVTASLRRHGLMARGVTLKLRYDDFTTLTRSQAMQEAIDSTGLLHAQALSLFNAVALSRPVRLIGVTAGPLVSSSNRQYSLFDEPVAEQSRKIDIALDAVRQRFGTQAIRRARLVEGEVGKESADDA